MPKLGVNIDHIATVRQARQTFEPDPVWAAALAQLGGADGITVHLREDRRHIQDRDVDILMNTVSVKLNLECACVNEMIDLACHWRPHQVCLVPENREEITTEGGLDIVGNKTKIADAIKKLHDCGVEVSLFIDADEQQVLTAAEVKANSIEIHTGQYALANPESRDSEISKIKRAGKLAIDGGLNLHAGHGLTYDNVRPIAGIDGMQELNIGHSIISRALMVGLKEAVQEMKRLVSTLAPTP